MSRKVILKNKKAYFDYEILQTLEAGISLKGDEVKSLREHKGSLNGAFAVHKDGEIFLLNCSIPPYSHAYQKDEDASTRSRRLLLHKREILKLIGQISTKGITLIPLSVYFNEKGKVKVEIGIAKHKKAHDKKESLKEKDLAREARREIKGW
ncbi:SsrA-binding protein SmpB [bacterium]|nr:SsrA-binding protein SmpB [bacterium]